MSLGKVGFACKYLHHDQTQKKKIIDRLRSLIKCDEHVTGQITQARAVHRYVGPFVPEFLAKESITLKQHVDTCETVLQTGKCDEYEDTVGKLESFKKSHIKSIRHIDRQIQERQKALEEIGES